MEYDELQEFYKSYELKIEEKNFIELAKQKLELNLGRKETFQLISPFRKTKLIY